MIPIIIAGGIAGFLITILASDTESKTSQFSEKDIITDNLKYFSPDKSTDAKKHATRTINKLIKGVKEFKLGKSGSPKDRDSQHTEFEKMFLIVESKDEEFINSLEGHYNEKYISNRKNKNCKIGSAGKMTKKNGRYFLYFIANEKTTRKKEKMKR